MFYAADTRRGVCKTRREQREHRLHRRELPPVDKLQAVRRPSAADGAQGKPEGVDDPPCAADCGQVARVWLVESISWAEPQCSQENC